MIHKVITTQNKQLVVIDDLNLDELIVVKDEADNSEQNSVQEIVSPLVEETIFPVESSDMKIVDRRKK